MICSCGRTLLACMGSVRSPLGQLNTSHDRLVLQRFADDAERSSPLKRARLAYEVQSILVERGKLGRYEQASNETLAQLARVEVPSERVHS